MNKANSFEMVVFPVADLTGRALDYAVAIFEGGHSLQSDGITWAVIMDGKTRVLSQGWGSIGYQPCIRWAQGGPIIEREQIALTVNKGEGKWFATGIAGRIGVGPTPLIAAMRYYIASKLGNSIKIPKELIEW